MNHEKENENPAGRPAPGPAIDPALEARVVAWVAGEASAFEAAELERLAAAQPELEIFRRRMAFMHRMVSEAAKPDAAPQRLAPERRAALLATLGGGETPAVETPAGRPLELPLLGARQKGWRLHRWLAAGTAAAACLAVGLIVVSDSHPFEARAKKPTRPSPVDTAVAPAAMAPATAELALPAGLEARQLDDPASLKKQVSIAEEGGIARRRLLELAKTSDDSPKIDFELARRAAPSGLSLTDVQSASGGKSVNLAMQSRTGANAPIGTTDRSAIDFGNGSFNVGANEIFDFRAPMGGAVLNKVGYSTSGRGAELTFGNVSSGGRVFTLANGAITVNGGATVNTQGLVLSTLAETRDFVAFTTTGNLNFLGVSQAANAMGSGSSLAVANTGPRDSWAGSVVVNNVPVSGDTLIDSGSRLNVAGAGGPTVVGGVVASDLASGSASPSRVLTVGGTTSLNAPPASASPGDIVKLDAFTVTAQRDAGYAAASTQAAPMGLSFAQARAPKNSPIVASGGSDLAFLRGETDFATAPRLASAGRSDSNAITLSAFSVSTEGGARSRRAEPAAKSTKDVEDKPLPRPAPVRVVPPADAEVAAADRPASTFSLHVSDVSFRLAQAALARGELPEAARIRPEEFYNAPDYGDPAPSAAEKIALRIEQAAHPVLPQRNLVRVAVKVGATGRAAQVPLRLTVLLDTSGSMEREDRAATVRRALASLAALLGPADRVTLIGFARTPRLLAEALPGDQARSLARLAAGVPAEGGTNLEEALKLAADLARRHRAEGAQNRIVLLTDGAANLGAAVPAQLAATIAGLRREGIALDACGVGLDGLNDEMLEALTRHGDGRYTVLNSPEDADAEFAKKLAGAFRPAAENVKLQVRFNPARVGAYRLVGFEAHRMNAEDFRNDAVDAAELAAEEAAVALYQVEVLPQGEGEIGEVSVRFRDPGSGGAMVERSWSIAHEPRAPIFTRASPTLKLAAVSSLLAEKLRGGTISGQFKLSELAPTMNMLRVHYAGAPRVEELATMFTQARRILSE